MLTNIDDLIHNRTIESSRIEYKEGWNPSDVAHTICAFANDIENIGGGYIVIGIEDENGIPKFPIKGIDKASIDPINKELMGISNLIEPRYVPSTEHAVIDGKDLLVIEVIVGPERPYRCPDSISKDKSKRTGKSFYIRKLSSTIVANSSDERMLFEVSSNVPFDCRVNMGADFSDLRSSLACEYLDKVDPDEGKRALTLPKETLFNSLKILGTPPNNSRPINAGLLFFNEDPDRFIEGARIEIVDMPDPTGVGMEETVIRGPLDLQIEKTMDNLRTQAIRVLTVKKEDTPVADRIYSYPTAALEEIVSNAVYHKDYGSGQPITVTIKPDRIVVTSIPGPDRSISDEQIQNFEMSTPVYRNARIGDLLKHRGLAEKRGTGVPTILRSLSNNGSPPPLFETDAERRYFKVTVFIHNAFVNNTVLIDEPAPANERRSQDELESMILDVLLDRGASSMRELADALGYSRNARSLYGAVRSLVEKGRVEYTLPDRMSSRNQKIRLRLRS